MSGNSFGVVFKITTFGESHGPALGVVVDGCPPRIPIDVNFIQKELDRRKPGQSRVTTSRAEPDRVEILSGIFEGKTTGAPIAMLIRNEDAKPSAYEELREIFRPGHADYSYLKKYGIRDHRGGGRASGRETVSRVAGGAIAKLILKRFGIEVYGATVQVGKIVVENFVPEVIEKNSLRAPDLKTAKKMEDLILKIREKGDSVGGVIEIRAEGVPAGLGEPVFDRLDAELAKALISIPGVKGVEFGDGFKMSSRTGFENSDPWIKRKGKIVTRFNRNGGILGGISTGELIVVRIAVKPTSSIALEQETVDIRGKRKKIRVAGRHDPCLCPRIVPVAEAMVALVLVDHLLRQKAQCGLGF